jgi:cell wall-associated NlpC family hydrolase
VKPGGAKVKHFLVIISAYLLVLFIISVLISFHKQQGKNVKPEEICLFAKQFLSDNYLKEVGENLDCSGFTRYVYKKYGYKIPRTSLQQFKRYVVDDRRPEPGDLVFFSSDSKKIGHVGIYLGKNSFIHSSEKKQQVVVDDLSKKYWKTRFKGAGPVIKREKD